MHTPVPRPSPKSVHRAFVMQFGTEADVADGRITGRVEHVSSGQATEFHSLADLLAFISRVLAQVSRQRETNSSKQPAGGSVNRRADEEEPRHQTQATDVWKANSDDKGEG